jgi:hypothetical protein
MVETVLRSRFHHNGVGLDTSPTLLDGELDG